MAIGAKLLPELVDFATEAALLKMTQHQTGEKGNAETERPTLEATTVEAITAVVPASWQKTIKESRPALEPDVSASRTGNH